MKTFVDWISNHALAAMLIAGTVFAIGYVFAKRKDLLYKK